MISRDLRKSHMLVEIPAVIIYIFILRIDIAYAGIEIKYTHGLKPPLQLLVQFSAKSAFYGLMIQIYGRLAGRIVSRPFHKGPRMGVSYDPAVFFRDYIGIFFHYIPHAPHEYSLTRGFIFHTYGSVFYIV